MIHKNGFLEYIKDNYTTKDKFIEEYGIRSKIFIGIQPKKLEFKPEQANVKKYEEFCIEKCQFGYSYKITYVNFVNNYIKWLKINYIDYKYTNDEDIEIREYFNKKFLMQNIHSTLGIWGIQLKTDESPKCNIRDKYTCKKIYKINVDTKEILEIYYGLSEASEKLNLQSKTISDYIRFSKLFDENNIKILLKYEDNDENVIFNKRLTLKKVYKINYESLEVLDTYDGIIGAANKLNISATTVGKYLKTQKTFKNSLDNVKVLLSYDKQFVLNTQENIPKNFIKTRRVKKIYKVNLKDNSLLEIYEGILDAAAKLNIGECTVSRYLKSGKTMKIKDKSNMVSVVLKHNI